MRSVVEKVQVIKKPKPKDLTRPVIRINGVWVTVKGYGTVDEPTGRFEVWVNPAIQTTRYKKALIEGQTVEAHIRYDTSENRWNLKYFTITPSKEEIEAEDEAWVELGNDY